MLTNAALGTINHLLSGEDWARGRLQAFAGQTVHIDLASLKLALEITPEGIFIAGDKQAIATVSIRLPADALRRVLIDRNSLLAASQISGAADLAECLGFISRNLSWDAEGDLSQMVGDIAARRLVAGGKQVLQWPAQKAKNLALNLTEYFTEENPTIASRQDVSAFCAEVAKQHDALSPLEQRIATLEGTSH
jgi:ubiquinone biosynthesis protein UbiJ